MATVLVFNGCFHLVHLFSAVVDTVGYPNKDKSVHARTPVQQQSDSDSDLARVNHLLDSFFHIYLVRVLGTLLQ